LFPFEISLNEKVRPLAPAGKPFKQATLEHQGLTAAQVLLAHQGGSHNILPGQEPKSFMAICLEVMTEPMFLMLVVAGVLYLF